MNKITSKKFIDFIGEAHLHYEYLDKVEENNLLKEDVYHNLILMAELNSSKKRTPDQLEVIAERMYECHTISRWVKLNEFNTKALERTNLCENRFCPNCKVVRQGRYLMKYKSTLDEYAEHLYHLTLTVPNVVGQDLEETINHMGKKFVYFKEYLEGKRKIEGLDFKRFGYEGGVRALEVTINYGRTEKYHPHFHVALVLRDYKQPRKTIKNKFSYSNKNDLIRPFSKDEILFQKIWRLLIEGKRVTKKNIDNLEIGYSSIIEKFKPGEYQELFKYLVKGTKDNGFAISYDEFVVLFDALCDKKQIIGYGCLRSIKDDENLKVVNEEYDMNKKEMESIQQKKYEKTNKKEDAPVHVYETPQATKQNKKYILISKSAYVYKKLKINLD